jgi:hypothetical protein
MRYSALLLAAVALASATAGCDRSGKTAVDVGVILPEQYRGYFWIVVDGQKGQPLSPGGNGVTLRIPADGVLLVRDDSFLLEWHTLSASYVSGRQIQTIGSAGDTAAGDVVWELSRSSDGVNTFLVGTQTERDAYYAADGAGQVAASEQLRERLRAKTQR